MKPVVNFDRYPEEREDPLTGKSVDIASARALREKKAPTRLFAYDPQQPLLEHDPHCPFCPGNEDKTPDELSRTAGNNSGWYTRTFDNLFPFLVVEEPQRWRPMGFFDTYRRPAIGAHRVIVGTPFHNRGLTQIGGEGIVRLLQAVGDSYFDLQKDKRFTYFLAFGNYGAEGGASQAHLHWQMEAKAEIPPAISERFLRFHTYALKNRNECLGCRVIEEERHIDLQVAENDFFVALVPFAAAFPYEVRIFPKQHHSSYPVHFSEEPNARLAAAEILREVLLKMKRCLQEDVEDLARTPDPPYNLGLHTARLQGDSDQGTFHYHFEIHPRVTRFAGHEYNTGQIICPVLPTEVAEKMRGVEWKK